MGIDYRDKRAVEKLFADYRAAKDSGEKELAEKLYSEIRSVHKEMSRARFSFSKSKEHIDGCKRRSLQRKKVKRKYYNDFFNFNLKDFSFILRNRVKDNAPVTIEYIRSNFTSSKKERVKTAFELALELKILRVRNGVYYKSDNATERAYEILQSTRVKEAHAEILKLKGIDPAYVSWNKNTERFTTPDLVDSQNEAVRLGMSDSAFEGGHGRKKTEEYNDKKALEYQRSGYGLKDKPILDYDLD